jgi:nucleotide-binding universal stress UspA family protein
MEVMKILATFDGSVCSESILPQLRALSALPGVELILLRVGEVPEETEESVVGRANFDIRDYLQQVARRLALSVPCSIVAVLDQDVRSAIVRCAIERQVDLIVMATHGRGRVVHMVTGDVAESVVRAGVAPVLLVPPTRIQD